VDIETIAVIVLIAFIDVLAFLEYRRYKLRLDEARKKSVQVVQPASVAQPSSVERIRQSIQTPLIVAESSSAPIVQKPDSSVEKLKNDNTVLQKKTDIASSRATNSIQTSLSEVGGKIDGIMSQVQSVKDKVNQSNPV
jgi:hypothetical protein